MVAICVGAILDLRQQTLPVAEQITILLINPKINLSTKEVFDKFDQNFSTEISNDDLQKTDVLELIKNLPNDLTKPAISYAPITSVSELANVPFVCDLKLFCTTL